MGPKAKEISEQQPSGMAAERTQASIITDLVRRDIIAGIFPPGSKLLLRALTERYGVGTIPLREALSRLAMSGFVEAVDQRGFRVAETSGEELLDIARVRGRIETEALRDAIEHGNLAWEGQVLAAYHHLSRIAMSNPDIPGTLNPEWEEVHEGFHTALLSACTSPWLIRLATQLREHSARYRHLSVFYMETGKRDVLSEHQAILNAVLDRNVDLAADLLADHLAKTARLASKHTDKPHPMLPAVNPAAGKAAAPAKAQKPPRPPKRRVTAPTSA